MNIEADDILFDDDDGQEADSETLEETLSVNLNAMRRIERYRELKHLRTLLDDPAFEYDFD